MTELTLAQVDSRDSFENVGSKWIAEINENCPGVRVVLTALKCDLRKDEEMNDNPDAITFDQGLAKAKEIGAVKYLGMYAAMDELYHANSWQSALLCRIAGSERASMKRPRSRSRLNQQAPIALVRDVLSSNCVGLDHARLFPPVPSSTCFIALSSPAC